MVIVNTAGALPIVRGRIFWTDCAGVEESVRMNVSGLVPSAAGIPVIAPVVVSRSRFEGSAGVTAQR